MIRKSLLGAAVLLLPLGGCLDDGPTGPQCDEVNTQVAETRGDTVVTVTGLRYIETELGTGATAMSCLGAAIDYVGSFLDGTTFDEGQPFAFVPGQGRYLPGFEQGVVGMKVGGTRRLIVPPSLGYGSQPYRGIPANSTLVFDVELLAVQDRTGEAR